MANRERAARAIEDFLRALGHEPKGDLAETGRRVADAWIDELLAGESVDARRLLEEGSIDIGQGPHAPVVLRGLHVATVCPHHLLPAQGTATVGYLPGRRVAGLGVIAQAVSALASRLTLQETLGESVAVALRDGLWAEGSFCLLDLAHSCLTARGERQTGARVETLALTGRFDADARPLALSLAYGSRA